MKLVIAIIEDEYIHKVGKALMEEGFRSTKLASTGGFLKSGNTTLIMGAEDEEVEKIVSIIRPIVESKMIESDGEKYKVGGANIFVLPMREYLKI